MHKIIFKLVIFWVVLSGCSMHEKINPTPESEKVYYSAPQLGEPRAKLIVAAKDFNMIPVGVMTETATRSKYKYSSVIFKRNIPIDSPEFNYLLPKNYTIKLNEYLRANEDIILSISAFNQSKEVFGIGGGITESCPGFYIKFIPKPDAVYFLSMSKVSKLKCGIVLNELFGDKDNYRTTPTKFILISKNEIYKKIEE